MAGNTRFMGFGNDGTLNFKRWGGHAQVRVDSDTREKLMTMCRRQLPARPPDVQKSVTQATFDGSVGAVNLRLDIEDANALLGMLSASRWEQANRLAAMLRVAVEDRRQYFDLDEPGVTDES